VTQLINAFVLSFITNIYLHNTSSSLDLAYYLELFPSSAPLIEQL